MTGPQADVKPLGRHLRSETVGYIDEASMRHGFVRAFARACADGVPVQLRQNVRAYRMDGQSHVVDERAIAYERLKRERTSTRQRLANDIASIETSTNELLRAMLVEKAEGHAARLEKITHDLEVLEASPAPEPDPTFTAATDVLLAALANLATAARLSLDEQAAFRVLVPELHLEPRDDGNWVAEATVRLPVADGMAELGPIRWSVAAPGAGVAPVRAARWSPSEGSADLDRTQLRRALEVDAGLAAESARLLVAAPFDELPHLMLHAKTGSELPEWIDEQWRHPRFIEHVAAVYGGAPGTWDGPTLYGRRMARAQAVVDCAADVGILTLKGYRKVQPGVEANEMWVFARRDVRGARVRGAVVDLHEAADGTLFVSNRTCRCGEPATIVAHAPEIPGSLLCECGQAVDAEPGSTADGLRFPDAYKGLRVSRAQWMRDMRRTCGPRDDELCEVSPMQATILRAFLQDPTRSWLCTELADVTNIGRPTCQWNLNQLRRRGFFTREGRPARFTLVDAADTRHVLDRS